MKDFKEYYFTTFIWMSRDLNLFGNDLTTFALIHQFSQGDDGAFLGGYAFLRQWGMSNRTAQRCVKNLLDKGLIQKEVDQAGKVMLMSCVTRDANTGKWTSFCRRQNVLQDNIIVDKKNTTTVVSKNKDIDFDKLLAYINQATGRSFKVINKTVRGSYRARLKDGYSKQNIIVAIDTAVKVQSHKENGFQYLTPEFFSRQSTLDKYGTMTRKQRQAKEEETQNKNTNFMNI